MNKKFYPFLLIAGLLVAFVVVRRCQGDSNQNEKKETTTTRKDTGEKNNRDRGFDRRTSYLRYTGHAECRMECRNISQSEVEDIMKNGKINYNKSNIRDARCPTYALEGTTKDNQRVRIVFGQCNEFTNVVTVIDLETDWNCHCPGDDNKYIQRAFSEKTGINEITY